MSGNDAQGEVKGERLVAPLEFPAGGGPTDGSVPQAQAAVAETATKPAPAEPSDNKADSAQEGDENDEGGDEDQEDQGGAGEGTAETGRKRKRAPPNAWTENEHHMFLLGLQQFGKGDWRSISRYFVQTRTPVQIASHAQKYFLRVKKENEKQHQGGMYPPHQYDALQVGQYPQVPLKAVNQSSPSPGDFQLSATVIPGSSWAGQARHPYSQQHFGPQVQMCPPMYNQFQQYPHPMQQMMYGGYPSAMPQWQQPGMYGVPPPYGPWDPSMGGGTSTFPPAWSGAAMGGGGQYDSFPPGTNPSMSQQPQQFEHMEYPNAHGGPRAASVGGAPESGFEFLPPGTVSQPGAPAPAGAHSGALAPQDGTETNATNGQGAGETDEGAHTAPY